METLWTILATPNEGLIGIMFNDWGIPFVFIEITVFALLFTEILNIKYTKKQFVIYVLTLFFISCLSSTFLDKPYSVYLNMIADFTLILCIFKCSILKGIIAEFIPKILIVILETIFCKISMILFGLSYEELYLIPIIRLLITVLIYLFTYLIYRLIKQYKVKIIYLESINSKTKIILVLNSVFAVLTIGMQFYIIGFYIDKFPFIITMLSTLSLIVYFSISIFSLLKTTKLEATSQSLEEAKLYNKTLQLLHDNIRIVKHDFCNIMQSISGYITNNDMEGLGKYYEGIKNECNNLNNLAALSPTLINDPALYSLIASKYHLAEQENITFNVNIGVNFNDISVSPYILTRILGILLDNALDAAKLSKEKEIYFEVTRPFKNDKFTKYMISIKNSYTNKDVDINRVREKGYTSKTSEEGSHGLGLWEINKILNKSNNINLHTDKNAKLFIQNLEIFKNKVP